MQIFPLKTHNMPGTTLIEGDQAGAGIKASQD
jgi:hypothetical protein